MDIAIRREIQLVLPVTEVTTWILAEKRERLPPGCRLALPATDSLRVANDKARVLELAAQLGIPAPRTIAIASAAEAAGRCDLPYPVVVKSARSRVLTAAGWFSTSVEYAENPQELADKLRRLPTDSYPVLLQERIQGPGVGVFACYEHGMPVTFFSHRRLREKPPSGGVSVLCESIPLDPTAVRHAQRLLTALRWHGVAMVEFRLDGRTNQLNLLEINGRFWGSLQLAIDAGVDFPELVVRIVNGEEPRPASSYEIGRRSRWFIGDFDALLSVLFRKRASLHVPDDHPGRLRSLWRVLNPWQRSQRNEVLRLDDPRPGLFEILRWLRGG